MTFEALKTIFAVSLLFELFRGLWAPWNSKTVIVFIFNASDGHLCQQSSYNLDSA